MPHDDEIDQEDNEVLRTGQAWQAMKKRNNTSVHAFIHNALTAAPNCLAKLQLLGVKPIRRKALVFTTLTFACLFVL